MVLQGVGIMMKRWFIKIISSLFIIALGQEVAWAISEADALYLANKFAPEVRFHKKEEFFPASINWIAQRSSLKRWVNGKAETVLAGPITDPEVLAKYSSFDPSSPDDFDHVSNYFLSLDKSDEKRTKENRAGMPIVDGKSTAPMYVHYVERPNGGLLLQYIFMYPHQGRTIGPENIPLFNIPLDLGMHEGDMENISVYLKKAGRAKDDYAVEWVYFAAHGSKPFGEMLPVSKVQFIDGTHVIVWAAHFGHASHSKNVGFDVSTLDRTSDGGVKWRAWEGPGQLINLGNRRNPAPGQRWTLYNGRLGDTVEGTGLREINKRNNSPQASPTVDNRWWREYTDQTVPIEKFTVRAGAKVSDYFDLKSDKIPIRTLRLRWKVEGPQAKDIVFSVNERKYLLPDRKNISGQLQDGTVTAAEPFKEKGIYISDIKTKSGQKITGPVTITVEGLEE